MRFRGRIALLGMLFMLVQATEYDYTIQIAPGKYECYFQAVEDDRHKILEIDYQVIDGGDLDVNFMVILGADVLAQDHKKTDGHHKIQLKAKGDYQFCFDNSFSYQTRKVVYFEVFLTDENGQLLDFELNAKAQNDPDTVRRIQELGMTLTQFGDDTTRIKNNLNRVEYYQSTLRSFENRDKAIMNANHGRVTFWSLLNTGVMILVAVVQVYTIRSLFEENSAVGKVLRRG